MGDERTTDLDRQLRESRAWEAAALRLAAAAGVTTADVEAEVAHHRQQLHRLTAERDRLEATRATVLALADRMAHATRDVLFTPAEVAVMLRDLLDGKRIRVSAQAASPQPVQGDLFSTVGAGHG